MDLELIVKSIMGLVIILMILVFLLFYIFPDKGKKQAKSKKKQVVKETIDTSLEALKKIIKKKSSTSEELSSALDLVIKHHGNISLNSPGKNSSDFDIYMDILFTICRHPNTNKNIIIKFDSALSKKNPTYRSSINDAVTKGLESRRIS